MMHAEEKHDAHVNDGITSRHALWDAINDMLPWSTPAELLGLDFGNALGLTPSTGCRHYPPRRVATFIWHPASTGDLPCT